MQQQRKDSVGILVLLLSIPTLLIAQSNSGHPAPGLRARDVGIPFDGVPGPFNAITDVKGVEVGYKTLISGDGKLVVGKGPVRTGVTAILPRGRGSKQSVFAGFFSGNGNGDMTGTHWIEESGVLETPILITNTNSVGVVRDAAIKWMVQRNQPGDFWYPVVAETADWLLNDIKGQHVTAQDALDALNSATGGPIQEGNVGGGTGMICNGFKGGTGSSSRKLDTKGGGYTVGVLVQCNYGRPPQLRIAGIPVAREMKVQQKRCVLRQLSPPTLDSDGTVAPVCGTAQVGVSRTDNDGTRDVGSIIVVVATDAPLSPDQLKRLARRVPLGLGRAGAIEMNGSGDIFIAFSTANAGADDGNSGADADRSQAAKPAGVQRLASRNMDPLFSAVTQATEEAVDNALIAAKTMTGANYWVVPALPHDQLREILRNHNLLNQ
ncbi:MAG: P1 family peptidase [Steroidobacteraceae bacterium]